LNYEPEWIELYNNSEYEIGIIGWHISDVVTNPVVKKVESEILFPPKSFLVITKNESIFDYHRNIQGLVIKMPFANLNNDSDGLVIMDQNSRTIDSLFYYSNWGGNYGRSLEKRNIEIDSRNENNWDSSIDIEGSTPGRINSISPKKYDLSISALYTEPRFPVKGERIIPWVKIKNLGSFIADNFELSFSFEINNENHSMSKIKDLLLLPDDSLIITSGNAINIYDTIALSVRVNFSDDEDTNNNYYEKKIVPGFNEKVVLINEIMFKTKDGEPEWIEILNNSDSSINIRNWQVGDSKKRTIITEKDCFVLPKEYLVLMSYSSTQYFEENIEKVELDLPDFGNKHDAVAIYDFRGGIIDSMYYEVSNEFAFSTSLERISLSRATEDIDNWIFSLDKLKSTPGRMNSISILPNVNFGGLIITEIMFNPNDNNCEFVELFNPSYETIELGGWKLSDEKGDYFFLKEHSFPLDRNEYFVLSADSALLNNYPYLVDKNNYSILNVSSMNLTNKGKLLFLKDMKNQIVDSISYSDSWHNSTFLETKNISIELININLTRNNKENWSSSVSQLGATPGKQNSINVENLYSSSRLNITPNPFSPDNDGYEDFTHINYNLTKPISEIRVRIFDSKGRFVRSLANSQSVGSKGTIIFDGLDKNKRPLKIGIYIILFEAISKGSVIDVIKDVVVIARKL
ncbi:MAG: lamin tail domain-containing protein, partial [Melioribacteraceae bacterium]|nr:lamin tail domain-containing protein [Melioribacteraceae bacterium]